MFNLRVKTWEDWETLCEYWMKHIAWVGYRINSSYQTYGRRGQKQHGVDIRPILPGCGIVGQSKYIQGTFNLSDLNAELAKTDSYPGPITDYFLLTTADHCTTIQNASAYRLITHKRPDNTQFNVRVLYWSDIRNLDFIPENVKHNLFPEAKTLFKTEGMQASTEVVPNAEEMRGKLDKLKVLLKSTFTEENIQWLENWDFKTYKMKSVDYDAFNIPYMHWTIIDMALRKNKQEVLTSFLDTKSRIDFYETWPVNKSFFFALEEFRKIAYQHYISAEYSQNANYLTISDLKNRDSIACQIESAARYLAQIYRNTVQ
ncbi:hypothetical protein [Pectobacterium carotovorum]|uniref:hypothetical protein n=1 Tax=Pectobacterium carotovorum TaxID=554 RepID=UPI00057CF756|nr:hypothetical protein [Pectobacterium carotovorum]KHT28450.1 hypothetical protein RC98_08060 [Pectobacterium carotovorum subsp. carotovorum]